MGSGGRSGGGFGGGRSSGGFKSGSSSRSSGSSSRSSGSKSNNSSSTSTNASTQYTKPSHSNKHTKTDKNTNTKTDKNLNVKNTPTLNNPTKAVQKSGSLSPVAVAGLAGLSAILIGRQINRAAHRDQQTNNVEYNQQTNNIEYNQQINNVEYIQQGLADCYICSNNNTRDSLSDFEFTTSSFEKMQDCVTRYNEDKSSISDTLCINFIQCLKERNIID
jgi:hypothetical protein